MKYLVILLTLSASFYANANTSGVPSVFKQSEVRVWEETDPTVDAFSVGVDGAAAQAIYDSILQAEQPHRGLFIKVSADGITSCQRYVNPTSYFCSFDLKR